MDPQPIRNCGIGFIRAQANYPAERKLPVELRANLPDSRIAGPGDDSKVPAADVSARIIELGVVENIEEFAPNLEGHRFSDGGPLRQPEIGIAETRAMKEPPVGRPEGSESCVNSERAWQEEASGRVGGRATGIRLARIQGHDLPDEVRHIRGRTAGKRCIPVGLVQLDGKAGGPAGDTLHLPALRQAFRRAFEGAIEGHAPNVASYEIVGYVGRRQPAAEAQIREIDHVAKGRGIVQGFGERV
jgi:hypothetical protein